MAFPSTPVAEIKKAYKYIFGTTVRTKAELEAAVVEAEGKTKPPTSGQLYPR